MNIPYPLKLYQRLNQALGIKEKNILAFRTLEDRLCFNRELAGIGIWNSMNRMPVETSPSFQTTIPVSYYDPFDPLSGGIQAFRSGC